MRRETADIGCNDAATGCKVRLQAGERLQP